jgi:hypothetical protein
MSWTILTRQILSEASGTRLRVTTRWDGRGPTVTVLVAARWRSTPGSSRLDALAWSETLRAQARWPLTATAHPDVELLARAQAQALLWARRLADGHRLDPAMLGGPSSPLPDSDGVGPAGVGPAGVGPAGVGPAGATPERPGPDVPP